MLQTIEGSTGPNPAASVIILHGLGADGNDFAPVVQMLDLAGCGDVRFVLPSASVRPVTVNGGMAMRAWYDIVAFGSGVEDAAGLHASRAEVEALIARERSEFGIASRRIVLTGFSQGCAMALLTGLRHAEPLGGIVGLSGYLPLAATTAAERHPQNHATPIFLGHGTRDPVVAFERGEAARDTLRALGCDVQWHAYPIEHSVSPEEIDDVAAFLRARLAT